MSEVRISDKKKPWIKGKEGLVAMGLVALLGVWLFFDLKKPVRDPDANPPVSEYVRLTSTDVTRVELKRPENPFVLVKQGGKWAFESPSRFRANSKSVDDWLKSVLEDAAVSQTVESKPGNMADYGLDQPKVELALTGGGKTRTLQIGKAFEAGAGGAPSLQYARAGGEDRLFMLSTFQVESVRDKKIDDLRDKRLVEIEDEERVQKVVLQRPSGTLEIRRQGEEKWQMLQPYTAPAEKFDVENLVSQLKSAEADAFAENAAADLAKYGLDQPRLTVRVTDKGGERVVHFGKAGPEEKVYAVREGEKEVTLVSKFTFESLDKTPSDLRDRKLITLEKDKITFVELRNPHGTVRLDKTTGGWQMSAGTEAAKQPASGEVVERVLNAVTTPVFKHVEEGPKDLAKYGLDKPEITVQVNEGAGTTQVFALGQKTGENYYAKGAPNAVFETQSYTYTDLNIKPDEFKPTDTKK